MWGAPLAGGQRPPECTRGLWGLTHSADCWAGLAWLRERLEDSSRRARKTQQEAVPLGGGPVRKLQKMTVS